MCWIISSSFEAENLPNILLIPTLLHIPKKVSRKSNLFSGVESNFDNLFFLLLFQLCSSPYESKKSTDETNRWSKHNIIAVILKFYDLNNNNKINILLFLMNCFSIDLSSSPSSISDSDDSMVIGVESFSINSWVSLLIFNRSPDLVCMVGGGGDGFSELSSSINGDS